MAADKVHQGRNVKRFREMLGWKQEALALELGDDWSQKKISLLEQKEEIEPKLLADLARVMKVPVEAFENFDEQSAINIISNTFNDNAVNMNYRCEINPIERWIEAMEENKKLYERLLASEREKVEMLERLIGGK